MKKQKKVRGAGRAAGRAKKMPAGAKPPVDGILVQARVSPATAKRLVRMAKAKGLRGRAAAARVVLEMAR